MLDITTQPDLQLFEVAATSIISPQQYYVSAASNYERIPNLLLNINNYNFELPTNLEIA